MKRLVMITGVLIVFTACQAVFTYSPVTFLQRDLSFSNLTEDQKIEKAQEILINGSVEDMQSAYDEINAAIEAGDETPETALLAADLAFGASGVTEVFTGILANTDAISEGSTEEIEALLDELSADDLTLISEGATHVQDAVAAIESGDSTVEVTDTQYIVAGASLIASAAEQAGGFDQLEGLSSGDDGYDEYQDAQDFLSSGGIDDLLSQFGL